jgi:hypothetical protein
MVLFAYFIFFQIIMLYYSLQYQHVIKNFLKNKKFSYFSNDLTSLPV